MLTEHEEQVHFIQWSKRNTKLFPDLGMLYASPNGGKRNIAVASKLKLEGVKPGIPDLFLAVAKHNRHGLYLELKRSDGGAGLSSDQKKWRKKLMNQGYAYKVVFGSEDAKQITCKYLEIPYGQTTAIQSTYREKVRKFKRSKRRTGRYSISKI